MARAYVSKGFLPVLLLHLLFVSCGSKDTIVVDPLKWETDIDSVFLCHQIIPLETNDSCLISEISDLKVLDGKYFILDKGKNEVLIFCENGEFLSKVSHQGRGHGEYLSIESFDVLSDEIYILSRSECKIVVYSYKGEFKNAIQLEDCYYDFSLFGDDIVLFSNYSNNSHKNFVRIKKNGTIVDSWDDFPINSSYCLGSRFLFNHNNFILYSKPYDYNVYEYDGTTSQSILNLEFLGQHRYSGHRHKDIEKLSSQTKNTQYVRYYDSLSRDGNYLLLIYPMFVEEYGVCDFLLLYHVVDKTVKNYCLTIQGVPSSLLTGNILTLSGNSLYAYQAAFVVRDIALRKNFNDSILVSLSHEDNPVLIKHELCTE